MVNSTDDIDNASPVAKPPRWPCREVDPIRRVIGFSQSWEGIVIAIVKRGSSEDEETWHHELPVIMPSMNRTRYRKQYKQEATDCRVAVVGLLHCGGRETRKWRGKQEGRSVWIYRRKMKIDRELMWDVPFHIFWPFLYILEGGFWMKRTSLEVKGWAFGGWTCIIVMYFGKSWGMWQFFNELQEFWFLVMWVTWKCQPVKICIIFLTFINNKI